MLTKNFDDTWKQSFCTDYSLKLTIDKQCLPICRHLVKSDALKLNDESDKIDIILIIAIKLSKMVKFYLFEEVYASKFSNHVLPLVISLDKTLEKL
eukprot:UN02335